MSSVWLTESMRPEDVEGVYQIEMECFSQPWSKEALAEEAGGRQDAHYLVVRDGGRVIGYGGFRQVLDEAHITNIAVTESMRGQGVAKAIMIGLEDLCGPLGIMYMTLEVRISNTAALQLYESCGFVSAGIRPGYYEKPREDAVIMWKNLFK